MKPILIFLILLFCACEKNKKYNFECNGEIILSIPGSSMVPDTLPAKSVYLYGKTFEQMTTWENNMNYNITIAEGNLPFKMESRFHCVPTYCPEY
jgi:hypothetical protein